MILAFDTSTDWLTIALGSGDNIIAELNEAAPRAHLSRLLPGIDALMKQARISVADIDYIAVGIGPGSFTGLRIAVATAQGLAHGLNRPLIGVSTLDAVAVGTASAAEGGAAGRPADGDIHPVLEAKRHEVYTAGYDQDGRRLTDYQVLFPDRLADTLAGAGRPVILTGDGLIQYAPVFRERLGALAAFADRSLWYPRASVLIRLVEEKIETGEIEPYFKILPLYIRLADAEEGLKREKSS